MIVLQNEVYLADYGNSEKYIEEDYVKIMTSDNKIIIGYIIFMEISRNRKNSHKDSISIYIDGNNITSILVNNIKTIKRVN